MTYTSSLLSSSDSLAAILAAMGAVAVLEAVVPLHARGRWGRLHLGANLALTALAFASYALLGGALVVVLAGLEARGFGLLPWLALPPPLEVFAAVAALDFATWAAHVSMHARPGLWRFHRVHHSDPAVDVTTTLRQHPGETLVRFAFLFAAAAALGASPAAYAIYRAASALNGLLEHANLRVPPRLDALLSLLVVTPHMHKVHHSRAPEETDTNYGNLFSLFDRLFSTFTPSRRGPGVAYGLEGFDEPAEQTTLALLSLPFRDGKAGVPGAAPLAATRG
jgi:sterol desaturase/sphingolipid hydroxylase (fatty acid hydroxylase superfamily)